jgi:hypothetical protein
MTNILSFSLVKSEYDITYDGDAFIIHWAVKGYYGVQAPQERVACV